ncbi:MerR family transcriptional regulator [Streptomyces uncialis]|uniref:MerR family transcriptional regulator n=1 Tax=Streptomyces uncialis TaxID=1048205 RepID=UPI00382F7594
MDVMLRLNVGMKSSEDGGGTLSIGALAARFGLATHVLRHWEAMDLLHPGRDAGGRRRYGVDDLNRVAAILVMKQAGLGLNTIRSLTAHADRATRHEVLRPVAEELRSGIAAAQASLELIEGGLNCEYENVTRCPNYRRLIAERGRSPKSGRRTDDRRRGTSLMRVRNEVAPEE